MSVTTDFWFFLLVCLDACSKSHDPRRIISCPSMCVRVNVLGSHNHICVCMGHWRIFLTPFLPLCRTYIFFCGCMMYLFLSF